MTFTDDDRSFMAQALRLAAEEYVRLANELSTGLVSSSTMGRACIKLSEQFTYQADKARTMAARIENEEDN